MSYLSPMPSPSNTGNTTGNTSNSVDLSTPSISPNTPAMQAIAGGYNPLQPNYLSAPPTLAGTYGTAAQYNPTTYNPSIIGQGLVNQLTPQQTIAALNQSVAPQEQQQNQQLMQMLAASGIAPGSTAGQTAYNNLAQQQLAGISPAIASAIQNAQGNLLNAAGTNVGALNSAGQFNAGAYNTGGQYNATNQQNMGLYNAGVANTANQQNLANLLNTNLYNTNAANTAGTNYMSAITNAQNLNQNEIAALLASGLSASNNLASGIEGGGNQLGTQVAGTFPVQQFQGPISYAFPTSTNSTQSFTTPPEINATNPQNYSIYGSLPYGQNAGDAGGG